MNRRGCLKTAGVLSAALVLALYGGPGDAADPTPVSVLVTYHCYEMRVDERLPEFIDPYGDTTFNQLQLT
jgi:hypothetical protein